MNFTERFIRRPVFATVLSLFILLLGFISYQKLALRQFPKVSASVVTVTTTYAGASAKVIEGFVTTPLESAIAGVNGIDYLESTSDNGISIITAHFKLGLDMNQASNDVSAKIAAVQKRLPSQVDTPIVEKQDPNAMPLMYISFGSEQSSPEQITDYLERVIKPSLETIEGVAEAQILGAKRYAMQLMLDPHSLTNHNLTASEVVDAVLQNNSPSMAGRIISDTQEYNISTNTDLSNAEQFNQTVLQNRDGHLIRLQDVGEAKLGSSNDRFSVEMNRKKAIVIGLIARSDANPLSVTREVNHALAQMQKHMPTGMQAEVVWDTTKFIDESIYEVKKTIIEAALFVLFVTLLFLGSIRTLLIPAVTIPLSLFGVCSVLLALGFSLNTLTFLAMVLAIGLVVDDAIVVAENIHRHIERGLTPTQAAIKGAHEIQFAVIAMTLTLAAVFAPIGFMDGLTGSLFKEFGFALAGSVIISGFIALTLTPMMCSKIMSIDSFHTPMAKSINTFFHAVANLYQASLRTILKVRIVVPVIMLVMLGACYGLYNGLSHELAPAEDMGSILTIVNGPATANLAYTESYTQKISEMVEDIPEKEMFGVINGLNGVNGALAFLTLSPWSERSRSVNDIINELMPKYASLTGVSAFPINPFVMPGTTTFMPITFVVQTTGSYEMLHQNTQKLLAAMQQIPGLVNVDSDLKIDRPEIDVSVNRNKAASLGIPMMEISRTINIALGKPAIGQFSMSGESYDIIPTLYPKYTDSPDAMNYLHVRGSNNNLIPLVSVAHFNNTVLPRNLKHFQQLRAATITAAIMPGFALGDALNSITEQADTLLSDNMQYSYAGESRQFMNTSHSLQIVFMCAIIFIFLVLAAQFESFIDPFIVMLSVPLSIAGALFALKVTGGTLNIYTQIGLVTLIGLISKHGILIVEFANQLREAGQSKVEAVLEASRIRLRPILMTTSAMLLSALPLALSTGAGAISRSQIGWVILGGMSFGTLMTLVVVPVMYTYLARSRTDFIESSSRSLNAGTRKI